MDNRDLSIVLPCYNEAESIPQLVAKFSKFHPTYNFELILVDNGSRDNSQVVLERLKKEYEFVKVVIIKENIGYGYGIYMGLVAACAPIVAYSHADTQTPPEDVIKAYTLIKSGYYDIEQVLIKGLRTHRRAEELFLTRSLAKIVEFFLGYPMEDINGQPKLFAKKFLTNLSDYPKDFSFDVYIMYMAKRMHLQLITFSVDFGVREYGESKWAATLLSKYKTIFKYLVSIFVLAMRNYRDSRGVFSQFIKFGITGVITNVANYSIFFMLFKFFKLYYVFSSMAGFFTGFVLGFLLNRAWTFAARTGIPQHQFTKFFVLNIFSLLVNIVVLIFCAEFIGAIPEIAQIVAILVSTFINFVGSKMWVFRRVIL